MKKNKISLKLSIIVIILIVLSYVLIRPNEQNNQIPLAILTELGPIEVILEPIKAPVTVANFLRYVDAGQYDGGVFHRTVTLANQPQNDIKIEVENTRLRPIDADLQIPNTEKFEKHSGWKPEISFDKTMLDLLNYWRIRVKSDESILVR